MIDVSKLPAVRAQLEQDAAAMKQPAAPTAEAAAVEYARAPEAGGVQSIAGRSPAVQRSER